jgi:hypothetical protein
MASTLIFLIIHECPKPSSFTEVRSFLGLAGLYWRFIKGFSSTSAPITELLKLKNFKWNENVQQAFKEHKYYLAHAPILALSDFKNFLR